MSYGVGDLVSGAMCRTMVNSRQPPFFLERAQCDPYRWMYPNREAREKDRWLVAIALIVATTILNKMEVEVRHETDR